jgi:cell wall-associated NlpC family hydrolase
LDNTTQIGAPLTRREAREIERRTGVRPVASAEPGAAFRREDTGRIERNEMTALISVLPTELVEQITEPAAAEQGAEVRSLTVRAPRPAALIAQRRRRTAGGFAAAASVTALAAVGLTTVAGQGVVAADAQHQANLLAGVNSQVTEATQSAADTAAQEAEEAEQAAEEQTVAAPAAESTEETEISTFDSSTVASAAVAVPVEVEEEVEESSTGGSSSESTSNASGSTESSDASAQQASSNAPATGSVQQTIVAYAQSMLGSYGMDCTDYVQNALAAAGLTTPRLNGGPDIGVSSFTQFGTQIDPSQAQPGDIMIKYGYHVSIYAGNGQAYHGGWNGAADDNVLSSYQGSPYFYDVIIRVG